MQVPAHAIAHSPVINIIIQFKFIRPMINILPIEFREYDRRDVHGRPT